MSNISQTIGKSSTSVTVSGSGNVKITNLLLTTKDTEYSHSLTNNLKSVIIKCREMAVLKLAFVNGESGTKYITIHGGCAFTLDNLEFVSKIAYIQASKDAVTVEIMELY